MCHFCDRPSQPDRGRPVDEPQGNLGVHRARFADIPAGSAFFSVPDCLLVRTVVNVFAPITRIRPLAWIAAALVVVLVVGLAVFFNMRKTINLSVDGEQREIVTYAASVGDVLEEEGIELAEHDVVAPDTGADLRSGLEIVVRYAHQLSIEVDGQ